MILANLLLALAWLAMTGQWTVINFAAGVAVGALLLAWLPREAGQRPYLARLRLALAFALFFVGELLLANLRVMGAILRPRLAVRPAIVAVPLAAEHSAGSLTLLANLITLTPGTLSIDIADDRRTLFVHTLDLGEGQAAALRQEIKETFERRVLEVMR